MPRSERGHSTCLRGKGMSIAEKLCLTGAFLFFMTGLVTGVWKYLCMARDPRAVAPRYVDVAHRSSLMYAFAALVLARFASLSVFPPKVNAWAAAVTLLFFALAIGSYVVHGVLRDTSNQLRHPHRLGAFEVPPALMVLFMALLIAAEIGGSAVLGVGAMLAVWQ